MLDAGSPTGTTVALLVLLGVIVVTVSAARIPPAVIAVPAAALLLTLGLVDWSAARDELEFMGPTIGFLAAMLVVAEVCARSGVFTWIGAVLARWSRGSPTGLLRLVFAAAALTTAVLSIDTTIVLLTPIAVATARRIGARVGPVGAATVHLANSASTLLPVSNLTNLLAFSVIGIGFVNFTGLMLAPWLVAIIVEYAIFRWFFADQLAQRTEPAAQSLGDPALTDPAPAPPRTTLVLLGALLVGFVVAEPLGVPLVVVAVIGAVVMTAPLLVRAPAATIRHTLTAVNVPFLTFVAALGIIILPVRQGPVGDAVGSLIPSGYGLVALLVMAMIAAVAANLLNNLPATLLLLPMVAPHPPLALAMLLGVNIGPNLSYFGSLANLLWRDVMRRHTAPPATRRYLLLGLLTVVPTLLAAVLALWGALQLS